MNSSRNGGSTGTQIGCLWLLGLVMLLPIIHYVLGVAVLVLAIASILYCVRLAKAIDVRNNLRQVLLGTRFTTTTICGIVREVEVSA